MNIFLLLFMFLNLRVIFCKNCPQGLHKAIERGFNVSEGCDDKCVALNSHAVYENKTWTGFCFRGEFALFPDWVCQVDVYSMRNVESFIWMKKNSCKIAGRKDMYRLEKGCLEKFNYKRCWKALSGQFSGKPVLDYEFTDKKIKKADEAYVRNCELCSTGNSVSNAYESKAKRRRTREISCGTPGCQKTSNNTETTSSDWSLYSTSTPKITETSGSKLKSSYHNTTKRPPPCTPPTFGPSTTDKTTTSPPEEPKKTCEENEYFFKDHCYFVTNMINFIQEFLKDISEKVKTEESYERSFSGDWLLESGKICKRIHPGALGLAVETEEENQFVMDYLRKIKLPSGVILLTSGEKKKGFPGEWKGWNTYVNDSLLNISLNTIENLNMNYYYCINQRDEHWFLWNNTFKALRNAVIVCERPYNPKHIRPDLYEKCSKLYRKSVCYNKDSHVNFCCAKDSKGDLWFGCPGHTVSKTIQNESKCSWRCSPNGLFVYEHPYCEGRKGCYATYNNFIYSAPIRRHAISGCFSGLFGYSSWYCGPNGIFEGLPDYSVCCKSNKICTDHDEYLNVWTACPSKTATKSITCPPGSLHKTSIAEWYCTENHTFSGPTPDYSNCNKSEVDCRKKDKYGREWTAAPGTTAINVCPPNLKGVCLWKCNKNGKFENPQPDCSQCRDKWMDEVADEIKKGNHHLQVMEKMANYTKQKDLALGFSHVLNLTSECVGLYKIQNNQNKTEAFDKFLNGYSVILKHVAANTSLWSTFLVNNRREYAEGLLNTTKKACFAQLHSRNYFDDQEESYYATFANFKQDGFDFFVSYNSSIKGSKFPLENKSESDWELEVEEVNEKSRNIAAMGLIMNHSLSKLMFPLGNETSAKELNAAAVTFNVAVSKNGEPELVSDVVVSIKFKHVNKTRFPNTQVIKRRLHNGEEPSGVFNSTICYYYRKYDWDTEGCSVVHTSKELTSCRCKHLSTIALLMTVHQYKPDVILETVSIISSSITIMSLVLTLTVFFVFDKVKSERSFIGKNLCFCLLVGHFLLITVSDKRFFYISDSLCPIYAVFLHYFFMAAFSWMFVEGYHLYRMLIVVFDSNIEYRIIYLLIGYGTPLIITGLTRLIGLALREQPYGQDELCWLKTPNYIWAFLGPVIVISTTNFLILIVAMKLAVASKMRMEKSKFTSLMVWKKGWISLSILLGITWLLGIPYMQYHDFFVYCFVVLNGLQGFFIFIFQCVLNEQYRNVFIQIFKSWFSASNEFKSDTSGTKAFRMTPSASKSSDKTQGRISYIYDSNTNNENEEKENQNRITLETLNKFSHQKSIRNNKNEEDVEVKNRTRKDIKETGDNWEKQEISELSYHNIYHIS